MDDKTFGRSPSSRLVLPACIVAVLAEFGFFALVALAHPRAPASLPRHDIQIRVNQAHYLVNGVERAVAALLSLLFVIAGFVLYWRFKN